MISPIITTALVEAAEDDFIKNAPVHEFSMDDVQYNGVSYNHAFATCVAIMINHTANKKLNGEADMLLMHPDTATILLARENPFLAEEAVQPVESSETKKLRTTIDLLETTVSTNQELLLADLEFFRRKLTASLKVPISFLGNNYQKAGRWTYLGMLCDRKVWISPSMPKSDIGVVASSKIGQEQAILTLRLV